MLQSYDSFMVTYSVSHHPSQTTVPSFNVITHTYRVIYIFKAVHPRHPGMSERMLYIDLETTPKGKLRDVGQSDHPPIFRTG